jgi:phage-related protein
MVKFQKENRENRKKDIDTAKQRLKKVLQEIK